MPDCAPIAYSATSPGLTAAAQVLRDAVAARLFPSAVACFGIGAHVETIAVGHARVRPERVVATPDTLYHVASLTKVVVTASLLSLAVQRGLIRLDDPLERHLDGLHPSMQDVTIEQLATHTSGLSTKKFLAEPGATYHDISRDSPAGVEVRYSCTNAILLGFAIERVFGRDLSRLANEYLFQPLRMTHARFGPLPDSPDIAGSHMPQTGAVDNIEVRTVGRPLGNAGLFVTAPDLARFSRAMLSKDPLGQTLAIGTTSRTRPPLPPRGLLWSLDPGAPHRPRSFSERAFGHGGYTGTALWIDPSGERFAVILTNRTHRPEPGHNDQQKPAQERRLAQAADAYFAAM